jgi:hypothetical protein
MADGNDRPRKIEFSNAVSSQTLKGATMKVLGVAASGALAIGFSATLALANPAMLPKHPGYPAEGEFANDPGQGNQTGEIALRESAASEDQHSVQNLKDPSNERLIESQGAGRLPKVEGPEIKIEPPVQEGTRMPKPSEGELK